MLQAACCLFSLVARGIKCSRTICTILSNLSKTDTHTQRTFIDYTTTKLPMGTDCCRSFWIELLMGRKITDVPQLKSNFIPKWEHIRNFRKLDTEFRQMQKENYDRCHGVKTLPSLPDDMTVWVDIQGDQVSGKIVQTAGTPQSYIVEVPSGELRRNRAHIRARTDLQSIAGTSCTTGSLVVV